MKTIIRLLKIVLPVGLFVVLLSPVSASIETPSYVGLCNPTSVTLSGNGVGEIKVDGLRVNDANGDWSVNLSIKNGSHNVSVDTESLDFNVPKCPEGGGIIGAVPCLGIFGPIGDACRAQNQSKVRFLSA